MNTISKLLGQYMVFATPAGMPVTTGKPLDVESTLTNIQDALNEYLEKDTIVALTVKDCFAKVTSGTRIQKLKMVVFAAICKQLPETSGEETQGYLDHIEEYIERNTSEDGSSLLGCKAGKGGGHFLWANEADNLASGSQPSVKT
jgi:hypothetical protein